MILIMILLLKVIEFFINKISIIKTYDLFINIYRYCFLLFIKKKY
jgi:hypothetical protein